MRVLHHLYSNEEWMYFQANLPIMKKNYMEKISRDNCSTLPVSFSWNVYKCVWLMAICLHHCLSEKKTNVQIFYQHILHCQKKTSSKASPTLYRARSAKYLGNCQRGPKKKLSGQVENISQKQNTSSKMCLNKSFPHSFSYQESWGRQSRKKAFLWNGQEVHKSLSVDQIVFTGVLVDMSKSFILLGIKKKKFRFPQRKN